MPNNSTIATTGCPSTNAVIGVLMLDTQFPRILGDIGHADSWPFPVTYRVVRNASARAAVQHDASALTPLFIEAAQELVASGVAGLTTSCGFLSLVHAELSRSVTVPFISSSLMQVPWINSTLPAHRQCGVLTIDASSLSDAHLNAAKAPLDTPVTGLDQSGEFVSTIMNDRASWDVARCREENIAGAVELVERHPDIGAIVLECTNMVPYAVDMHRATGLPIYSIHTLVHWLHSGLAPATFCKEPL